MTHQSSRDAAKAYLLENVQITNPGDAEVFAGIVKGDVDELPIVQAFERHREMVTAEAVDELKRLRSLAAKVFDHLDYRTGSAPGHGHKTPGVWDITGNPPERAGKPCEWCALWNDFRAAIYQGTGHD
jgi:hypothetical protein